jgi:RimJ/RimL family protein N-acetyltransferase
MSASIHSAPDGTVLINTLRLQLRAARPSDAEALHLCFSDPEVMRYWYVARRHMHPETVESGVFSFDATSAVHTRPI